MELRICHLYPDILNLYGDRGNIICMEKRLTWRGIDVTTTGVSVGEPSRRRTLTSSSSAAARTLSRRCFCPTWLRARPRN